MATPPIPTVAITVQDQGGSASQSVPLTTVQLKVGVSIGGTPNVPLATSSPTYLQTNLTAGPLVEAGGLVAQAGNVVVAMPIPVVTKGSASAVVATVPGGSTSTITTTLDSTYGAYDSYLVEMLCTVAGTIGTAPGPTVQFSGDHGLDVRPPDLPRRGDRALPRQRRAQHPGPRRHRDSGELRRRRPRGRRLLEVQHCPAAGQPHRHPGGTRGLPGVAVRRRGRRFDPQRRRHDARRIDGSRHRWHPDAAPSGRRDLRVPARDRRASRRQDAHGVGRVGRDRSRVDLGASDGHVGPHGSAPHLRGRRRLQHAERLRQRQFRNARVPAPARVGSRGHPDADQARAARGTRQEREPAVLPDRRQPGDRPRRRLRLPRRAHDPRPRRGAHLVRNDLA